MRAGRRRATRHGPTSHRIDWRRGYRTFWAVDQPIRPIIPTVPMRYLRTAAVLLVLLASGCASTRLVLAKGKITYAGKTVLVDRNTGGVILMFHTVAEPA